MTEKTDSVDIHNSFEMLVPFPRNLIFREIVYVDTQIKDSARLIKKHGVRYFKPLKVYRVSDGRGINVVFGRILRWEAPKIHDMLVELQETNENSAYDESCAELKNMIKEFEKELEKKHV